MALAMDRSTLDSFQDDGFSDDDGGEYDSEPDIPEYSASSGASSRSQKPFAIDQSKTKTRSSSDAVVENPVIMEGWLKKKNRDGLRRLRMWKSRYFVLYGGEKQELRYFETMKSSTYGNVPLKEKGCLDLSLLKAVDTHGTTKHAGCRFDLQMFASADSGSYLLAHRDDVRKTSIVPSIGRRVVSKPVDSSGAGTTRVISLEASTCAEKVEWLRHLSPFIVPEPRKQKVKVIKTVSGRGTARGGSSAIRESGRSSSRKQQTSGRKAKESDRTVERTERSREKDSSRMRREFSE